MNHKTTHGENLLLVQEQILKSSIHPETKIDIAKLLHWRNGTVTVLKMSHPAQLGRIASGMQSLLTSSTASGEGCPTENEMLSSENGRKNIGVN